jgi:hypothetical protein
MIPAFSAARGADQMLQTSSKAVPSMRTLRYPGVFSGMREILHLLNVERCGDRTIGILDAAREGDRLKPAGLPSPDIPPIILGQDVEKALQLRSRIVQTLQRTRRVRLGPSLAAALLEELFEHPAERLLFFARAVQSHAK